MSAEYDAGLLELIETLTEGRRSLVQAFLADLRGAEQEIEQLRAERDEARAEVERLRAEIGSLTADRDLAWADEAQHVAKIRALIIERDDARDAVRQREAELATERNRNHRALRELARWLVSQTTPAMSDPDDGRHIGVAIAMLMGAEEGT
jgi:chromosome segregation ATPase